jgi:hypothetical protein
MRIQTLITNKWIIVPAACFWLFFSLASVINADTEAQRSMDKEKGTGETRLSTQQVTLEKKTALMVMSNIGERYHINTATMIIGPDGEQADINTLLVPCHAELTYEIGGNGKLAHRIVVLTVLEGASDRMWKMYR